MPELVTIPISYFEVTFDFEDPSIKLWLDRAEVVQAMFTALKPWDIDVDDVDAITTGKPSEQGVKFKLPAKRSTFFFGPALCKFTRDATNWSLAEETIQILDAAMSALLATASVSVAAQKTVIALHLQPKTAPFFEILKPFVPSPLAALEADAIKTMAAVAKWNKRRVTIDGSGQVANGIFLRFEREFAGNVSYKEIADQLMADEGALFEMLGIKEE
ncbi:hypothetical protein HDF16_002445 [Granulicella aggregans]|uniref:Uncharacterized protein n=1 Tax=Granulicella aggregans TaxID=474949 RepID=A0A7W8E3Y9_9BACT|nr:hypothetical protein [Granulicella aggregans]MBB5057739.1 hypothetical protein [Granulicella aggregans]